MSNESVSIVKRLAQQYKLDPEEFFDTLKKTAFKLKDGSAPTNEQMIVLLTVCETFYLNPFLKELYAYVDKSGAVIPVVSVDGWSNIVNKHPQFDGVEFRYSDNRVSANDCERTGFEWIECAVYRKDRGRPIVAREFFDEVYRPKSLFGGKMSPWQTHPKRFHRHKAFIQASRLALGFGGIYDEDEAQRILDSRDDAGKQLSDSVTQDAQVMSLPDIDKLTPFVQRLIERAKSPDLDGNGWAAVKDLAAERLKGADLAFANQKLDQAETQHRESLSDSQGNANDESPEGPALKQVSDGQTA